MDKSIGIIIGTRTGQSESQSDPGQSMSRMIVIQHVHGVNEHIVGDICRLIILPIATHGHYASIIYINLNYTSIVSMGCYG